MKIKSFMLAHKATVNSVITSTCLVGATAGIVFGVSAGTFTVRYMDLENADNRLAASQVFGTSYYSEDIGSDWNMYAKTQSDGTVIPGLPMPRNKDITSAEGRQWWLANHPGAEKCLFVDKTAYGLNIPFGTEFVSPTDDSKMEKRYNYSAMIIDGASHTTMDRSFNQSLYSGLVDFNHNYIVDHLDSETSEDFHLNVAHSHKPSQDNDTAFMDMYKAAARDYSVIGLAGFNHASPLQKLMVNKGPDGKASAYAYNSDPTTNKTLNETGFILLDSNISNNQTIASVQFRSDQPGFLAAMSVCQYFMNNLELYHNEYQPISVGLFGGVQIPSVVVYMGGFQRGVEFFNNFVLSNAILTNGAWFYFNSADNELLPTEKLNKETFERILSFSKYKTEVESLKELGGDAYDAYLITYLQKLLDEFSIKIIKLGDASTHFSGSFIAGDGIGITKQYLNRGASAIIVVAGPQSLDAAQEIQNQNSKCIVVGVDTPMEDGDYQRFHQGCDERSKQSPVFTDPFIDKTEAPDHSISQQANAIIKFSAVKDIRSVSRNIDFLCANGQHWDNDARLWEHLYQPKYDDENESVLPENKTTLVLSPDNCIYEKVQDEPTAFGIKITGLKDDVIDPTRYESIAIPQSFILPGNGEVINVTKIGSNCFDFRNGKWPKLKNIRFDTKINLEIESKAFINDDEMSIDKPHVICLDFSEMPSAQLLHIARKDASQDAAFSGAWNTQDGMICLKKEMSLNDKAEMEMRAKLGGLANWAQVCPSPTQSICGPGFQTCGNIQNGLISISWDGMYPLLSALAQLRFDIDNGHTTGGSSLFDYSSNLGAWHIIAQQYLDNHPFVDKEYRNAITDVHNLFTFKRVDDNGKTFMYDNFNHTIAILGQLLETARFDFYSSMTLVRDENGQLQKLDNPLSSVKMSILDWLTTNMYLLS